MLHSFAGIQATPSMTADLVESAGGKCRFIYTTKPDISDVPGLYLAEFEFTTQER